MPIQFISSRNMIEDGLYDNEPSYVRATIYEKTFGNIPYAVLEVSDALLDYKKVFTWLAQHKFEQFHVRVGEYHDDGEERNIRYYRNMAQKQLIMLRRTYTDESKVPSTYVDEEPIIGTKKNNDPNKFTYFAFLASTEAELEHCRKFIESIRIKEDPKNKLYMLKATEYNGLELDSFPTNSEGMKLELNYGNAFMKTHEHITELLKNKKSGLYVFHGPPGTGKTSYIKYLTTIVDTRKFIFVPNTMVADLFSPKLVDKLYAFKNSVLVLEDAEICVFKRDGNNNALVSGILNITDGLLKDLLNISIMVTFNSAEIHELDEALLRKGRLAHMHKFDLLSWKDAKALATHLKRKKSVTKSMSLADVYNLDEETGLEEVPEKAVGFLR